MYRLKTPSHQVAVVLSALAEGLDASAAARVFGFRQVTITTWLTRAGRHAQIFHERSFRNLHIPLFTGDGLNLYFYALTAHFGRWLQVRQRGCNVRQWQVAPGLIYGQVKKCYRRRKLVRVTHVMRLGTQPALKAALEGLGLSGRLNTAFILRLEGHPGRKLMKVPAEDLDESLASGKSDLSGLSTDDPPARKTFTGACRIIHDILWQHQGVGEGIGLGLDSVYRIVVGRHHGDIQVASKPGDTSFQVRLPIDRS